MANDIIVHGAKVERSFSVNVAKILAGKLDDVSAKNKRLYERSPLMPTYDPSIEYISTEFTFALL